MREENTVFGDGPLQTLTKTESGYWKMMDLQNGTTTVSNDPVDPDPLVEDYGFADPTLLRETEEVDG